MAKADERLRGDVRIDWCKTIVDGTTAIKKFLQSDFAPTILCTCALANAWLFRKDPKLIEGGKTVTSSISAFASIVERSNVSKKRHALKS